MCSGLGFPRVPEEPDARNPAGARSYRSHKGFPEHASPQPGLFGRNHYFFAARSASTSLRIFSAIASGTGAYSAGSIV